MYPFTYIYVSGNLRQRNPEVKMTDIHIKKVTFNDIDQLQKIGRQTFYETFSDQKGIPKRI